MMDAAQPATPRAMNVVHKGKSPLISLNSVDSCMRALRLRCACVDVMIYPWIKML